MINKRKDLKISMGRRVAREELFKLIFECELINEKSDVVFNQYLKRDEIVEDKKNLLFIEKCMKGIAKNENLIIQTITSNLTGWSFERIGTVEKALLKIAVYEILVEKMPYEIVINEAVELAKIYGDEKSSDFINGVLAKIVN